MRSLDAQKLVGKVVVLELINSERVCTRVEAVTLDGYLTTKQLISFVATQNPNNPAEARMIPMPYGSPIYDLGKNVDIDLTHIMFTFPVPAGMEEVYNQLTSSIALPPKSSLIV
jgi:hypothetical protein